MQPTEFSNETIDLMGLPSVDTVEYQQLSRAYFYVSLIGTLILLSIVTFAYFVFTFILRDQIPLIYRWMALGVLGFWWIFSLFRVYKVFQKKAFAVREKDVHYKSGWLWKKQVTLPYNRIQHCELSSGPLDRLFEITELHIYTAGGSHSDISIPGLNEDQGQRVKKFILDKIGNDEEE